MRNKLIANGVKNLHEFGYANADAGNILTDEVYSAFFAEMLKENIGIDKRINGALNGLIDEINANKL